jgi:hypothetical protein
MAIAPIDLQTLFSQVDKVGKAQAALREGQAIQQAVHGAQIQRKTDEQIQQINETQDTGEGVEKINDRTARQKNEGKKEGNNKNEDDVGYEAEDEKQFIVIRDPSLGNKIDISY